MQSARKIWLGRFSLFVVLLISVRLVAQQPPLRPALPHPFQTVEKIDESTLAAATARVLAMEDEQIVQLISELAPIHLVGCPDFPGGAQDTGADVWSIDDPGHVKCRYTDETYPSERYPLNGAIQVVNPRGQVQVYRYYDGGSEKQRYLFEGAAQEESKNYLAERAYDLGRLYWATKDEKYAHKAAVILDRFAQVYPGWPVHGIEGNYANWKKFYTSPPYPVQSGKWGRWIHDELPTELALAYDLIHDSIAFQELSQRHGTDVRKRIENDLFRAAVELVRSYPRYLGASGMNGTAAGMIAIGRAIEEPDYVHDGVGRFKDAFTAWFFSDGMLHSGSPAYHLQMLGALPYPARMARGYSDPPGYVHPGDGLHLENLDLEGANPALEKAQATVRRLLLPDGRYTPLHDAWARSRFIQDKPLSASQSALLPAYGHAVLGRGREGNQIQAQLHFGYHAGHAHADELNLLLFAHGKEMLSDIGYTHTKLRPWATSTLSHNTVVVDRLNQAMVQGWIPASWSRLDRFEIQESKASEPVFGSLLLYDTGHDHVQVVEAEGSRGYREQVPSLDEYRRLVALVGVSPTDAYVVDIFRVRGGKEHLWAAHGSADEDQQVETSLALIPQNGTLLGPGTHYSAQRDPELDSESFKGTIFGLIDGLAAASTNRPWSATWHFAGDPKLGLKLTVLGGSPRKITLGDGPSIRRAGEDNAKVDQFKMPLLLVEDAAQKSESIFAAIWEPFAAGPFITEVKPLAFEGEAGRAVALAVRIGDRWDYILSDPEGTKRRKIRGMKLAFRGRFAVVSETKGKVQFMHLAQGTELTYGAQQLRSEPAPDGKILAFHREGTDESFETDTPLPTDERLGGRLLVVRHPDGSTHGYTIRGVKQRGGHSLIEIEGESGLALSSDGTYYRQTYFPHTEYKQGLGSFVVQNTLCTSRGGHP